VTRRRVALFAATALVIVAADQVTKALVRASFALGESRPVIRGVLWLTHVKNTGAAFGMLRGQQWLLVSVAVTVLIVIAYVAARVRPQSLLARTALAMIAAGACGNLIDRAFAGGVTDFMDLGWWPVFNIADMSLDIGVAILVWWLLFGKEHALTDTASTSPAEGDDPASPVENMGGASAVDE